MAIELRPLEALVHRARLLVPALLLAGVAPHTQAQRDPPLTEFLGEVEEIEKHYLVPPGSGPDVAGRRDRDLRFARLRREQSTGTWFAFLTHKSKKREKVVCP